MSKGIFIANTPKVHFVGTLEQLLFITTLLSMVLLLKQDIAYFAYMVSPSEYHTSGVTSLFEPKCISINRHGYTQI